jgi:peroxiredoxin
MRKPLYVVALALAAVAAGVWLAQTRHAAQAPAAASDALWRLSFPDVHGQPQALSQWRGQVVVLNFWASWCAPCREEMSDFAALQAQYRARRVVFVGVAIDNSANVTQFLRRQPVDYPILIGEGAAFALASQLGNPSGALPYTIVLDRDGRVALRHLGRLPRANLDTALRKIGA